MTLDDLERHTRDFIESPSTAKAFDERDDPRIARALLAVLPVVRAAVEYHRVRTGQRTNGSQQTMIERSTHHTLMHSIDEMRRGLEGE